MRPDRLREMPRPERHKAKGIRPSTPAKEAFVATVSQDNTQSGSNNNPQPGENNATRASRRDRRPAHTEPSSDRVAAEAAAIYPDTFDTPPSPDEIAAEAYAIYESRGGAHGRHEDDWFEAERRCVERRQGRQS
jgi:hypothetical protein